MRLEAVDRLAAQVRNPAEAALATPDGLRCETGRARL